MPETHRKQDGKVIEYGPLQLLSRKNFAVMIILALCTGLIVGVALGLSLWKQSHPATPPSPAQTPLPNDASALNALKAELQTQQAQMRSLSERLDIVTIASNASPSPLPAPDRNLALLLAVMELRERIQLHLPYNAELITVQTLAQENPDFSTFTAKLSSDLATPPPSSATLRHRLDTIMQDALRDPRPALDALSLWQRIAHGITAPISIRRIGSDTQGDSAEAILARAEAALAQQDIMGFLDDIEKLKGFSSPEMDALTADARKLVRLDHVFSAFIERLTHALAPVSSPYEEPGPAMPSSSGT